MLAGDGQKLVSATALRNLDAILVCPLLDFCNLNQQTCLPNNPKVIDIRESVQESRSLSVKVSAAAAADLEAEACRSAAFRLAIRALRRTLAISLSRVVG